MHIYNFKLVLVHMKTNCDFKRNQIHAVVDVIALWYDL